MAQKIMVMCSVMLICFGFRYESQLINGDKNNVKNCMITCENANIGRSVKADDKNGNNIDVDNADDKNVNNTDEGSYAVLLELEQELGIDELDYSMNAISGEVGIHMEDIIDAARTGDSGKLLKSIGKALINIIMGEILLNKNLMIELIFVVLLGSIFVNLSNSLGNNFISENGFYVTYLIITSLLLTSFSISLDMVSHTLEKILLLIRTLVPFFLLSIHFLGKTSSALGTGQVIIIGIWIVEAIILKFVLPMIKFYVMVSMINNLNQEDNFSRMCGLIKKIVLWLLKSVVMFILGINLIKSLLEPQMDLLERNVVKKVVSFLPGSGALNVMTSTFLGAGMVIKNSIGVFGILFIAIVVLIPILKCALLILTVKITSAMIQPIGDKRYGNGMEALSEGLSLLMQTLMSSSVLFMLTIAIISFATNQV